MPRADKMTVYPRPPSMRRLERRLAALHPDVDVFLTIEDDGVVYLDLITVKDERLRGHGLGTEALEEVLKWADQHGLTVALQPVGDDVTYDGAVPEGRLVEWYKRHGFVVNLNPDRRNEIEVGMYRMPRSLTKTAICETLSA